MPESVVKQLQSIIPDVPEPIMAAAGEDVVKRYLLKQASVLDKQNVIMGGTLDKLYLQALETNGRVTTNEGKIESHGKEIDTLKTLKKLAAFLVIAVPAADVAIHWLAKTMGVH